MTIKECIEKQKKEGSVPFQECCKKGSVSFGYYVFRIGFVNTNEDNRPDETELDCSCPLTDVEGNIEELSLLYHDFCIENGLPADTVEYIDAHIEPLDETSEKLPPLHYYIPSLGELETADTFFRWAGNYVNDVPTLKEIQRILTMDEACLRTAGCPDEASVRLQQAERVGYIIEREEDGNASGYSLGQMKLDFLDGMYQGVEDVPISDTVKMTVVYEHRNATVLVQLSAIDPTDDDYDSDVVTSIPIEQFLKMDRRGFDKFLDQLYFYSGL